MIHAALDADATLLERRDIYRRLALLTTSQGLIPQRDSHARKSRPY
jgi:hypothetical protein